jgi:hypothetical protein
MDTSYEEEEAAPLISRIGIPTAVQDNRRPYEKQRAVYIILASTLFERIAFYTLAANLAFQLESEKGGEETLNPSITSFLFSGEYYYQPKINTIEIFYYNRYKLYFNNHICCYQ